jgi:gamma-glutamyltranspeptidase / glutathione hydrolase
MPDAEVKDASTAGDINCEVYFEEGIDPAVVKKLCSKSPFLWLEPSSDSQTAMGHDARIVQGAGRGMMGRGQVIQRILDRSGKVVWAGGSDPRIDGHVVAQI